MPPQRIYRPPEAQSELGTSLLLGAAFAFGLFVVMIIQRRRHAMEAQLARLESLTLSHYGLAEE